MKKTCLIVNVSGTVAAKLYSGEEHLIPCRQIPDHSRLSQERTVYLCENNQITGTCTYICGKAGRDPIGLVPVQDCYGLYVCWDVKDAVKLDAPMSLKDLKLKKVPNEWCYVTVNG